MTQSQYFLPSTGRNKLEAMVARVEANPGIMVDPTVADSAADDLIPAAIIDSLPEGLNENDLIGILQLAMLTECATESYASEICRRARLFDAEWLARFTERVWTPDELTHHTPYKTMLLKMGFSEAALDDKVRETQEKHFEHVGGFTPVHVSTFGMVQEYLTDHWHGLVARLLKPTSPIAAHAANLIKRRETLHTIWYRDMTALQVEANPELAPYIAFEVSHFRMPGNSLVPELQALSSGWLKPMGTDFGLVAKDLVRLVYTTVGTTRLAGKVAIELAKQRGVKLGPIKPTQLTFALDHLGGRGYGLVGEAILQSSGLSYMYQTPELATTPSGRIRALFRTWLAERIPLQSLVVSG